MAVPLRKIALGIAASAVAIARGAIVGAMPWGPSPALQLNFASGVLDSRVTASGGANGTRTNASGAIVAAVCPRFDYSPVAIGTPLGVLVEEARTNLFLNSLINGAVLVTQGVAVTAQQYTISFYGTGSITLSGAATATINGTGAYPGRVTYTFTPAAGTLTCTVAGSVQYAQIEAGSFATSFIPTAGAAVTRRADVLAVTGSSFTSFYTSGAGTLVVEAEQSTIFGASKTAAGLWLDTGNRIGIYRQSASAINAWYNAPLASGQNAVAGVFWKAAIAWSGAALAFSAKGAAVVTATYANSMAFTTLAIGDNGGGGEVFNGHIRTVCYYATRLSDGWLQAVSA